jgi:hypothetical protein
MYKNLIEELNADDSRGALPPSESTKTTLPMHFYDTSQCLNARHHTKKCGLETGGWPERVKRKLN